MKRFALLYACCAFVLLTLKGQDYTPSAANLEHRQQFQDMKFGMFIHWGIFSLLGDGEWVMNNRNIHVQDYKRLIRSYNPVDFDAQKWVAVAKNAGMQYITFITRHHDGFSNWDTQASDWKVMNTPYGKDVFKLLADECHRQGIKLFVYYSLLDWGREDYPHETGRTGQGTGRKGHGDYSHYLQFMKDQLTELLTNYGEISGVWFDGHWDQTAPEGASDRTSRINWHYDEIYGLIHRLQPHCLIGNNHHMTPFPGEDFQLFERDLPGENRSGLSFQQASQAMPLETCETMNDSWGFNVTDHSYKSVKTLVRYLVNAAGRNANLLLNIGPMADGKIQPQFTDTLLAVGNWMKKYGESIYGTRGNITSPQDWGVLTAKNKTIYVHIFKNPGQGYNFIPGLKTKVMKAVRMGENSNLRWKQQPEGVFIYTNGMDLDPVDTIIELQSQ